MKLALLASLLFLYPYLFGACGGGDSNDSAGSDVPTIETLGGLPRATGPVTAPSAAASAAPVTKAATMGMNLRTTDAAAFSADSSMGACQSYNYVRTIVGAAAEADMVMCFVDYIDTHEGFIDTGTDIYDGAWHIFKLDVTNDPGAPDKVKMRVAKNEAGSITSLEMFMCKDGTQNGYALQMIDGAAFALQTTGSSVTAEGGGWYRINVDGMLNPSGTFATKTIVNKASGIWGGNAQWQESTLTHTPSAFAFTGYEAGEYTGVGGTGTYQNAGYAEGELIDTNTSFTGDTYDIGQLAIGDGAVKYLLQGAEGGTSYGPTAGLDAWYGDTRLPVAAPTDETPFYVAAIGGTPPDAGAAAPDITFASGETWDCSDDVATAAAIPTMNGAAMNTACQRYMLDHERVNCWEILGNL